MAKDGSVQTPKRPEQPATQDEQYWQSEEGQDIARYMERVQKGELDMPSAIKEFRQKWYGGKSPRLTDEATPNGPTIPQRW